MITLPLETTSTTLKEVKQISTTRRSQSRGNILLAEDDSLIRSYCVTALALAGFDVDVVEDGAAAWEFLQRKRYDLLISDNDMPFMSGVELIARARRVTKQMPVLLISGGATAAEICRRAGFENWKFLPKPFTKERLVVSATEMITFDKRADLAFR